MLASLPLLLIVFGTPVAVLALLPADWLFRKATKGHDKDLSSLYMGAHESGEVAPRLASAARAGGASIVIVGVGCLAAVLGWALADLDRAPAAAGPLVAAAALLPLLVGLRGPGSTSGLGEQPAFERRALMVLIGVASLLVVLTVAAGLVSVADPPSTRLSAYPQASLTQWSYSYDGFPKDFEWTPNGVTTPWPGWYYGLPLLGAVVAMVLVAVAVETGRRRRFAHSGSSPAMDAASRLVFLLATSIAGIGLCAALTFVLTMGGDVLSSISLFAKPQLAMPGMIKPYGHTMPEFAFGQVGLYSWVVLVPVCLALFWMSVFALRGLAKGRDAARRAAASGRS